MPQIDENQASPAADTFPRRFAAAALDVVFVALPAMLLAATAAERFPILEQTGDRARFSVPDQLRINEIDQGLNRAMQLGDTVVTLSGAGLWMTLITLALLTVLVFFVIPGLQRGQTPGRSLMRLAVRTDEETDVELLALSIAEASPPAHDQQAVKTAEPAAKTNSPRTSAGTKTTTSAAKPIAGGTAEQTISPRTNAGTATKAVKVNEPDAEIIETDMGFYLTEPGSSRSSAKAENKSEADEDHNRELRELLQSDIERGTPPVQVTLADDDEYDQWTDLNDLDLVDHESSGRRQDNPFETLTLPESSLSETPLTASTGRAAMAAVGRRATATVDRAAEAREEPAAAVAPEWSEELQSWVYRDEATNRWFRHDQDTNRWIPTDQ